MDKVRSKYSKNRAGGLSRDGRAQLSAVLRKTAGVITPASASKELGLTRADAAKLLARWAARGWLRSAGRGLYVPVALESERADAAVEDAWLLAEAAFSPAFISGWSAAEHWGITEQVFRTVSVSTARRIRDRAPSLGGIAFRLRTVPKKAFFGLSVVWRGRMRVQVSDPSRTIVDLMMDPAMGGGSRSSIDMFQSYLRSKEQRNVEKLIAYARTLGTGSVFKRMGFLLERFAPEEREAIAQCARFLSQGNAKLDPTQPVVRLATSWRLWLPAGW